MDLYGSALGVDNDTGGQIVYVLQVAEELVKHRHEVTIVTRLLSDSDQHNITKEKSRGVELIRLPMQSNKYIAKEKLWPLVWSFADSCLNYFITENKYPNVIIANYADAGAASLIISRILNIPVVFIPHSLGRVKLERLLEDGQHFNELESQYQFSKRIFHEEQLFKSSNIIIVSSEHEKEKQCFLYTNFNSDKVSVIPPGILIRPIMFHRNIQFRKKPILMVARLSKTKNLISPIDILAASEWLRENAEIVIGTTSLCSDVESRDIRDEIERRSKMYEGFVEFIQCNSQEDIFGLFLSAKDAHGVYFNPALIEPFGLTALESAAHGLPVVLTNNGGTNDIIKNLTIGYLVDVHNHEDVINKVCMILRDENYEKWKLFSNNGMNKTIDYYSWNRWVQSFETICPHQTQFIVPSLLNKPVGDDVTVIALDLRMLSVISDTDVGFQPLLENNLKRFLNNVYVVYLTECDINDALCMTKKSALPHSKVFICESGHQMYAHCVLENKYKLITEWANRNQQNFVDFSLDKLNPLNCDSLSDRFGNTNLCSISNLNDYALRWLLSCWSVPLSCCTICYDLSNYRDLFQGNIKCFIIDNNDTSKEKIIETN